MKSESVKIVESIFNATTRLPWKIKRSLTRLVFFNQHDGLTGFR